MREQPVGVGRTASRSRQTQVGGRALEAPRCSSNANGRPSYTRITSNAPSPRIRPSSVAGSSPRGEHHLAVDRRQRAAEARLRPVPVAARPAYAPGPDLGQPHDRRRRRRHVLHRRPLANRVVLVTAGEVLGVGSPSRSAASRRCRRGSGSAPARGPRRGSPPRRRRRVRRGVKVAAHVAVLGRTSTLSGRAARRRHLLGGALQQRDVAASCRRRSRGRSPDRAGPAVPVSS